MKNTAAEVIVYTKPGCTQCTATFHALAKLGITPEVRELATEADRDQFRETYPDVLSLPYVLAGGEAWTGYRPDKLTALTH